MADIIYATPQKSGFSLGDLVPIALIAAVGLGAYWLLKQMNGTANGTPSQGTNTGPQVGAATDNGGSGAGVVEILSKQGSSGMGAISDAVASAAKTLAQASTKPVVVTTVPNTNIPVLNVNAGKETPVNFFPSGNNVISYSTQPDQSMINETVNNLLHGEATQGITNAWWQAPTITQTTQPGGVNSGGSYQSNIPVGKKHCPCTAALKAAGVCGPNDDWYYC